MTNLFLLSVERVDSTKSTHILHHSVVKLVYVLQVGFPSGELFSGHPKYWALSAHAIMEWALIPLMHSEVIWIGC